MFYAIINLLFNYIGDMHMKLKYLLFSSLSVFSLLTGCSSTPEKGDKGDKGDIGETGEKGDKGDKGEDGKDGSKIYTGSDEPLETTGVVGDLYINTSTGDVYTKGENSWTLSGNIKGAQGDKGDKGDTGSQGTQGDKGDTGVSITSTYIDDDGNLICVLSNGNEVNAGKIKDTSKHTVNFYVNGTLYSSVDVLDGSKVSDPNIETKTDGYDESGWYTLENGRKVPWSFIGSTVTSDVNLYFDNTPTEYSITYILNGGTNSENNPTTYTIVSDTIKLEAPTKNGQTFAGWYSDAEFTTACSSVAKGSKGDKVFYALFVNSKLFGAEPIIDATSKKVTYGIYPQTHVSDTTLIAELDTLTKTTKNGWYYFDGNFYAKANGASSNYSDSTFADGTTVTNGSTYWFKCEPITWKILESDSGTYTLLSEKILTNVMYSNNGNNYKNSNLRKVLNGDFYNYAFSFNNSYIQTVEVDNSAATTIDSTNTYACANTNDKVYLLSYQDYLNADYGFSTATAASDTRKAKSTDYALNNGVYTESGYGCYWTRSPRADDKLEITAIYHTGSVSYSWNNQTNRGICPVIQIKVS